MCKNVQETESDNMRKVAKEQWTMTENKGEFWCVYEGKKE
mgnify:CR=1 FL=1